MARAASGSAAARITAFAVQGDGSRAFAVTVKGLRVLVTANEGQHDAGMALADAISALGPELNESTVVESVSATTALAAPAKAPKRREFRVGQQVWCNVHGSRGYCKVTEVGTGRNAGRIKISGFRAWCPVGNFDEVSP